jgi:hypothetical protein
VKKFLAGRMPHRKQFAEKFISPLSARVLSLSLFIHLTGNYRKILSKFCHPVRIGSPKPPSPGVVFCSPLHRLPENQTSH